MKSPLDNKWGIDLDGVGSFGFDGRKHSIHTGVDLYTEEGQPVFSVLNGIVVSVEKFTGPKVESPWYNETYAVMIQHKDFCVLYGEIEPVVDVGEFVFAGQKIGNVMSVLKKDKGNGTSMLHFEMYKSGTKQSVWWNFGEQKPHCLLDPTDFLRKVRQYVSDK